MNLPEKIFFTGVPGSSWSQIAQTIEQIPGFNVSDRTQQRSYTHSSGARHLGAYFGTGMEFPAELDHKILDTAWQSPTGTKLIKSHEWAYKLDDIKEIFKDSWIMMVYRPTKTSYQSWTGAGGFDIAYPKYEFYGDYDKMLEHTAKQNNCMLKFAKENNLPWEKFTPSWCKKMFGHKAESDRPIHDDLLVALLQR